MYIRESLILTTDQALNDITLSRFFGGNNNTDAHYDNRRSQKARLFDTIIRSPCSVFLN
jgi:hypothetical protein